MNITITNPHEIEETLTHSAELAVIEAGDYDWNAAWRQLGDSA